MTQQKDLKRLVRARMRKTGESYTAARAKILAKPSRRRATKAQRALSAPPPADYAAIAGMSDAAVKAKTGCPWERWVRALDHDGAEALSHRDIAKLVHTKYEVGSWWTQMVTVGYERIKGLRGRGQDRDGRFEATKSRTFNVPVTTLFDAWADARTRSKWLDVPGLTIRKATRPKTIRVRLGDGSIVAVGFTAKGDAKSVVALSQDKLASREEATRVKESWEARLAALANLLPAAR